MTIFATIAHRLAFIKARLFEPSTWIALSAAIPAAAAVAAPYSYIMLGLAVMIAMTPNAHPAEPQ